MRADRNQEGDLVFGEHALRFLLHDEHAHRLAEMHERYRQKPGKLLLSGFREIAIAWVFGRVRKVDWLLARCDQSDDPFAGGHPDLAHRARVQSSVAIRTYCGAAASRT